MSQAKPLVVICGPTGTGKTSLALSLCKKFGGVILSADSRQVYRRVDIGTGKLPLTEKYQIDQRDGFWEVDGIPIYFYDLVDPDDTFDVQQFQTIAYDYMEQIWAEHKIPFLVGGTGLYVSAVVNQYQFEGVAPNWSLRYELERILQDQGLPTLVSKLQKLHLGKPLTIDLQNPRRVIRAIEVATGRPSTAKPVEKTFNTLLIGLTCERPKLYARVDARIELMIEHGLLAEVTRLLNAGYFWDCAALSGIGYRQLRPYIEGNMLLEDCIARLKWDTHAFVRRQYTWFNKMKGLQWVSVDQPGKAYTKMTKMIQQHLYG